MDWHYVSADEGKPDWLDSGSIVFVRHEWSEDYGPIAAGLLDWSKITQFRLATSEVSYR